MPEISQSTAAYVEIAIRAAEAGDNALMATAVMSMPVDELHAVEERLAYLSNVQQSPLGDLLARSRP